MAKTTRLLLILFAFMMLLACGGGPVRDVVRVKSVKPEPYQGLDEKHRAQLEELRKERQSTGGDNRQLKSVIKATPNYTLNEYLAINPDANNPSKLDYKIGGYDVLDIIVYEEADLSREGVRVSAEGHISFPLIGRVYIGGMSPSEVETLISRRLAEGQYLLDAHVSVTVTEYNSKKFIVLGSVKTPGTYALKAQERLLDAISKAGGIDFEQGGKQGMIIRTLNPNSGREEKIVIRIELTELLKGGDQLSNILLTDKDLLYIPKADYFYIIGQVLQPGSYPYLEKDISLVEAISKAGGFTPIAARNKTRIIRVENGVEQVIKVKVDAITEAGEKGKDVIILPGDVIVVPESFF